MPQKCPKSLCVVVVVGKPNLVKDFCPRLLLDLCFDFDFGLGQAFQFLMMQFFWDINVD